MAIDGLEYRVWENREPATLVSPVGASYAITDAKRRMLSRRELAPSYGRYQSGDVAWYVPNVLYAAAAPTDAAHTLTTVRQDVEALGFAVVTTAAAHGLTLPAAVTLAGTGPYDGAWTAFDLTALAEYGASVPTQFVISANSGSATPNYAGDANGGTWRSRPVETIVPGWTLTDASGVTWTALTVDLTVLGTVWKLTTRNLSLSLPDTIDVQTPTVTAGGTGDRQNAWANAYTGIAARVQPDREEDWQSRGRKTAAARYLVYVGQQVEPRNAAGDWGRVKWTSNGNKLLEITGVEHAQRIDEFTVLSCVLNP